MRFLPREKQRLQFRREGGCIALVLSAGGARLSTLTVSAWLAGFGWRF